MRDERCDVAIVGGGIIGAFSAAAFAAEGLKVVVLEAASDAPRGATAASMGHLVALDGDEPERALSLRSLELWDQLAPELPRGVGFDRRGTLWIARNERDMQRVELGETSWRERGIAARALSAEELARREPELAIGLAGGLLVPGDAVVHPLAAAELALARARDQGAEVRRATRVTAIASGRVEIASGTTLAAERIVIAAGCATPHLWGELLPAGTIVPKKGHLVATERRDGFCRHQLVEIGYVDGPRAASAEVIAFNLQPRANGVLLLGSSRQIGVADDAVEPAVLGRMIAHALELAPGLARVCALRAWAAARPATRDGLPLIGALPGCPGVLIAAGHEGLGVTAAPATAELLVDLALGRPGRLDPEPYAPARFSGQEAA